MTTTPCDYCGMETEAKEARQIGDYVACEACFDWVVGEPPLVAGGQGRTNTEVSSAMSGILIALLLAVVFWAIAGITFLLT